jgi:hypothetical protein
VAELVDAQDSGLCYPLHLSPLPLISASKIKYRGSVNAGPFNCVRHKLGTIKVSFLWLMSMIYPHLYLSVCSIPTHPPGDPTHHGNLKPLLLDRREGAEPLDPTPSQRWGVPRPRHARILTSVVSKACWIRRDEGGVNSTMARRRSSGPNAAVL